MNKAVIGALFAHCVPVALAQPAFVFQPNVLQEITGYAWVDQIFADYAEDAFSDNLNNQIQNASLSGTAIAALMSGGATASAGLSSTFASDHVSVVGTISATTYDGNAFMEGGLEAASRFSVTFTLTEATLVQYDLAVSPRVLSMWPLSGVVALTGNGVEIYAGLYDEGHLPQSASGQIFLNAGTYTLQGNVSIWNPDGLGPYFENQSHYDFNEFFSAHIQIVPAPGAFAVFAAGVFAGVRRRR